MSRFLVTRGVMLIREFSNVVSIVHSTREILVGLSG